MSDPRLNLNVVETDPSARVQLRSLGQLMHPGSCALCGSGNNDLGYVDLDIYFDYEGQIYLCVTCVELEVIPAVNGHTREQADHARTVVDKLTAENTELHTKLGQISERLRHYDNLLNSAISAGVTTLDVAGAITQGDTSNAKAVAEQSAAGESKPEEPVKVRRRNDSSQSASSDSGTGINL